MLLQIITDSANAIQQTASTITNTIQPVVPPTVQQKMSLMELIMKGGWIMIPIGILSVVAVFFAIERAITIARASRIDSNFMAQIRDFLTSNKMEAAIALCKSKNTPIARLLLKGLKRIGKPIKEIESAVESEGRLEIYKLERNLNWLGIIAGVAPMLGFVGTISGVIKIFYEISVEKNISIDIIAGGLYEKMITSATGLVVGIFAHICFHYLNSRIDRISYYLESSAVDFLDLIQEPA